ncbi:MAG: protein-disulfide reductase DsbD [Campylobacteraceae bacterium]|nr:protein-disulfide reductase DsbD [Campylobacteraceae bacterium]
MKKVLLFLFSFLSLFAVEQKFLSPEEAIQINFVIKSDKVVLKLELADDIYLYEDKLKISIIKPEKIDIKKDLDIQKPELYHEFIVHFNGVIVDIPYALLKEKIKSPTYTLLVKFQGCSTAGLCYAPMKKEITLDLESMSKVVNVVDQKSIQELENLSESDLITASLKNGNIAIVLLTFFGFGLLLSLTPCIFPMIPILSSIIVKASSKEKLSAKKGFFLSFVYVFSMSLAYTIAGVIAGLFGANLQVALQNPIVLSVFAGVFVLLALSMFGYFKLELPQSLQNKINKTTDGKEKQGVFGIAVMGFLSALIVGPCVAAPLAGALIYIGQTGDALLGGAALFILSFGMGVPLLLIGLGAGKYMPKPGAWMDSISKVFGLIMLAIAIYMLDRVLDPTIIMYLWSLILIASALYLQMYTHILSRLLTTMMLLYGIIVFIGAVTGATNVLKPLEKITLSSTLIQNSNQELKWTYIKDIDELYKTIEASSKPVMLDFYADWCISCKELENFTFKDPRVIVELNKYTLLKADVTENNTDDKNLQNKFNIVGPPGLIFWNQNKKEIKSAKIVGYKNADEFLEILKKVK